MSLLLLFRARESGDVTISATPGILSLRGGTHTVGASHSVALTPGIIALKGGTHTITYGGGVVATPGLITFAGGTHTVDNGVPVTLKVRPLTGVGL